MHVNMLMKLTPGLLKVIDFMNKQKIHFRLSLDSSRWTHKLSRICFIFVWLWSSSIFYNFFCLSRPFSWQGSQTQINTRAAFWQKRARGLFKEKQCLCGPQKRVKSVLISHKITILSIFDDKAGCRITSGGPCVWDPCFMGYSSVWRHLLSKYSE